MKNELRLYIRKFINEQFLEEDYESIQAIKTLANDALKLIAKENANRIIDWHTELDRPVFFTPVSLKDIYEANKEKYPLSEPDGKPTVGDFIKEAGMVRIYLSNNQFVRKDVKGNYTLDGGAKRYFRSREREINAFYSQRFEDKVRKKVAYNIAEYDKFNASDLYLLFYYEFTSTLIHELQHAYDDFRSDTKMYQTKEHEEFRVLEKQLETMEEKDKENFIRQTEQNKKYLNLSHEVWARFSQAMDKMRFSTSEFIKNEDGKSYFHPTMKDINQVVKDFKIEMDGFHILEDDVKKRLIRKIAQFWHIEKDKVDEEIKNPKMFGEGVNLKSKPKLLSQKIFTQAEMIPLGGNYHLHHGMLMMIPVDKVDGLDPTPGGHYDESGDYVDFKPGKSIEKPIEVVYDEGMDLYMLYDGNHRITQAKMNGDKYIKAFVQAEKEMYKQWRGLTGINESAIEEDYPEMFKMDEFKTLTSFSERIRYCEAFLTRISSGSSRIVYEIDNDKVLKLAKNKKGVAQNEVEVDFSKETYMNYLFAKVYDYEENFLWIEMQKAEKMTEAKFAQINMYSFKDFAKVLKEKYYDVVDYRSGPIPADVHSAIKEQIIEDEFYKDMVDYMVGYEIPVGDLLRPSSYGIVNGDEIVLVDFGFTEEVAKTHYSRSAAEE